MKAFGYTADKAVVPIILSDERIVAMGIDPWRLDLFDEDPLSFKIERKALQFKRLSNLSFFYRREDGRIVLGLHDGKQPFCLVGKLEPTSHTPHWQSIWLRDLTASNRSFVEHFAEYLSLLGVNPAVPAPRAASAVRIHGDAVSVNLDSTPLIDTWANAQESSLLEYLPVLSDEQTRREWDFDVDKGRRWRLGRAMRSGLTFEGKMLEQVRIPTRLPERINRVFDKFRHSNPAIVGRSIRTTLRGKRTMKFEVLLDDGSVAKLTKSASPNVIGLTIAAQGSSYHLTNKTGRLQIDEWYAFKNGQFSIDMLWIERPNEVGGTRIAFHDLARMQARVMLQGGLKSDSEPDNRRKQRILEEGFEILYFPELVEK